MRFARLDIEGKSILALNTERGYFPVAAVRPSADQNIIDFMNSAAAELTTLEGDIAALPIDAAIDMEQATFLVPVARPGKIICLGLNYHAHAAEGGFTPPEYPVVFFRAATSLTPHAGPIKIPAISDKLDYEGEMAVIIGKSAYQVSKEDALDYVAGYSIFNDATIRDYQKITHQWTVGKNFDQSGGFGPELVTADELPAGGKGLQIRTLLNGEILQDATTADMIFDVAKVIELMSQCFTLEPGDVIVSGTPEGVGYVRKPPVYMRQGDEVVVEIEGIGRLVNSISHM